MDIQIVSYDSYQSFPSSIDKNIPTLNGEPNSKLSHLSFKNVPVIRIYGKINTGHPCQVHVHNIFPYIYIHFPEADNWLNSLNDSNTEKVLNWYNEINWKLVLSFKHRTKKRKPKKSPKPSDTENIDDTESEDSDEDPLLPVHSYISDISVVSGIPFYGFYLKHTSFLKISLTSPKYVTRLSRLLTESKIFDKFVQPYESHIPYLLQFLADYNIFTLKNLNVSEYLFRSPITQSKTNCDSFQQFFQTNFTDFNKIKVNSALKAFIDKHIHPFKNALNILNSEEFPRTSRSIIELDILSSWILNIDDLKEREVASFKDGESFSEKIQYISSTKSLLDDVENLRKQRGLETGLISQLGLSDNIQRTYEKIEWNDQAELNKLFNKCVEISELSYKKKYKDNNFQNLKVSMINSTKDTSFQNIRKIQFEPKFTWGTLLISINSSFTQSIISKSKDNTDSSEEISEEESDNDQPIEETTLEDDLVETKNSLTEKLMAATSTDEDSNINSKSDINILDSLHISSGALPTFSVSLKKKESKNEINNTVSNEFIEQSIGASENVFSFDIQQPTSVSKDDFLNTFEKDYKMPKIEYLDPFFSKLANYDAKPFVFAGDKFQLTCKEIEINDYPYLTKSKIIPNNTNDQFVWKYTPIPPTFSTVENWLKFEKKQKSASSIFESQIRGPTQKFKGYKYPSLKTPVERMSKTELQLFIVEIHVNKKSKLSPDPKVDEISAIFCNINWECFPIETNLSNIIVLTNTNNEKKKFNNLKNQFEMTLNCYSCELDMIIGLVSLIEFVDPDILCGYELHNSSWGYIIERCKFKYNIDISQRFSRVSYKHINKIGDRWGYTHASGIKITGRQMFNLWRRLRSELNLNHYSLENIIFHIFHETFPFYTNETLSDWWFESEQSLSYLIHYYCSKIYYEMEIIKKLELVEKINEQSRLLGIDFYSIIYRGSQFKVECLLCRLAKAENFIMISPSKKQVFKQDSLECIPLVMEPNSSFFKSPLVVLDFQSLYPSLIIAYNICYSTMLGRLKNYNPSKYTKMGVTNYKSPEGILKILEDQINITPNGIMFAKENVRKSLLAKMLTEILNARIYIKNTMNEFKDDQEIKKLYDNRQLALKLIANVTYGYTSASYSGRMPNSDIADAIVSCGRETLLKAIKEIEKNIYWGAKVVYGDTDSLFIYLPGKTKEDAFRIGKEMADHVTSLNPKPIKLKFEKVYLPSVLVSKKRYIGWSFEYEAQLVPKFDAKGIETVRRDGVPAQQKILEKSISLFFETRDISLVKEYVLDQFIKIVKNKVNIKDFMFAKEVRLGTYKNEKYIPPGARISMKRAREDHRSAPQYKERVFYIVRKGYKKETLRDRCMSPDDFLNSISNGTQLDSEYYINKVLIPPLERIFNLFGVDIKSWVREIPQKILYGEIETTLKIIRVSSCICCGKQSSNSKLCVLCKKDELKTILALKGNLKKREERVSDYLKFCQNCSTKVFEQSVTCELAQKCYNEDCSVYYSRLKSIREVNNLVNLYNELPEW